MFKCILIHAKGCHHCEELVPQYTQLPPSYPSVTLELLEFSPDIIPWYNRFIPKKTITETLEDGSKRLKRDDQGNLIYDHQLAFPNAMFFHNDQFIGNVVGNNLPAIKHVLDELSKQRG